MFCITWKNNISILSKYRLTVAIFFFPSVSHLISLGRSNQLVLVFKLFRILVDELVLVRTCKKKTIFTNF